MTLEFSFAESDYRITRGKSGAALQGPDVTVTGQKEVRLYMEKLLGVTADMAASLLFADQGSVRGVLNEGATAAGGLVEKLADLSLIEQLVGKIEAQLPCGNTKALQMTLDSQKEALTGELTAPDATKMVAAKSAAESASAVCVAAALAISVAEPGATEAEAILKHAQVVGDHNAREKAKQERLQAKVSVLIQEPAVSIAQIEQHEKDAANIAEAQERYSAYQTKFPVAGFEWEGSAESFHKELADVGQHLDSQKLEVQRLELHKVRLTAKVIKDNTCAFCQKDLTYIPEVVKLNADIAAELADIDTKLVAAKSLVTSLTEDLHNLKALAAVSSDIEKMANRKYWNLSDTVPPVASWIGEVPAEPGKAVNTRAMRKSWEYYNLAVSLQKQSVAELATLDFKAEIPTEAAKATIQAVHELHQGLSVADSTYKDLQKAATAAELEFGRAESAYASHVAAKEAAKLRITDLEKVIADTLKHNDLIKKLRSARGPIATKLWATTLHTISNYFSDIRGTRSVITRDAEGFKCDGKAVDRLSGSTLDSLGLAIRLALSKIFLPNVPFLFLDEAAAGCDDTREIAMLATVAASGFQQVLLVTHSDLGDSLANNLINV